MIYTAANLIDWEDIMKFPLTWAALNVGLATAATYLLCSTDLLSAGAIVMFH